MSQLGFTFDSEIISSMKYYQYRIIAEHMFKWTNLPPGLDSSRMERMLIDHGTVCLFNTLEGWYILPYSSHGHINVYGDLITTHPVTFNGAILTQLDYMPRILYDNSARMPFRPYLMSFANRLAHIQKSISICERQARLPSVIKVTETNKDSWGRVESKIDEGYPVIFVDAALDPENAVGVFDTGFRPEILTMLWDDYNKVEGEIYSLLGTMFNVEQNKQAGVGTAETIVNYAQTFAFANSRLQERQRWCEKVNAELNMGIWCEKSEEFREIAEEMMNNRVREPGEVAEGATEVMKGERQDERKPTR
jgi:hypothetical protein